MPSTNESLSLFKDYLRTRAPTPSGILNIDVSEKLHTRICNLLGKRNKKLTYTFSFPHSVNQVTLHRRGYIGELPAGTRLIATRETPNGPVEVLHIVTEFEVNHGFIPEELAREVRRFEGVGGMDEIARWIDEREPAIDMFRLPGIWRLDFANEAVALEFRLRWEGGR